MSAFSVMAKGSCMCVLISVYRSTQLTETAVIDKLFRDEVMFWAPVADVPDSSIAPPANGRADHRRAASDTTPPAGVMDLQVDSYDAVKRTVTLTWTSRGDDGRSGTASRYDIRMAESEAQITTNFTSSPKVESGMILSGLLIPKVAGTTERIAFKIPNKATWKKYVFALKTFDEENNESPVSVCFPHISTTTAAAAAAVLTQTVPTLRRHAAHQSHQSQTSHPNKSPDVGVIVGGFLSGVAEAAVSVGLLIKMLYRKKTELQPNPLEAKMTEPSVPHVNFALTSHQTINTEGV